MTLIDQAIEFAAHAHRKQKRKGTKIPYISHPYAVGLILQKAGCKEEVVAAGILHDTLEDTKATREELSERFGPAVLEIVEGCSEPDKEASWEERKQHTLDYLRNAPLTIRLVACADKLHNIRSVARDLEKHGEETWERFKRGRELQQWYYTGLVDSLGHASRFPLLEELQEAVAEVFDLATDSPDWKPLRMNKKFMKAAFETADGKAEALAARMPYFKKVKASDLLTYVHENAYPITNESDHAESFAKLSDYLRERGLPLAYGTEEADRLIGFAAVLMNRLHMYPSEAYHRLAARKPR
ncbi:HD domain-containing protein [Cohnella sp. GCM10027633]|uniref:HD domain-containing protein n=1 Tax=unclassified Cohnella TaxID=2636738 RepID=UPI003642552D